MRANHYRGELRAPHIYKELYTTYRKMCAHWGAAERRTRTHSPRTLLLYVRMGILRGAQLMLEFAKIVNYIPFFEAFNDVSDC